MGQSRQSIYPAQLKQQSATKLARATTANQSTFVNFTPIHLITDHQTSAQRHKYSPISVCKRLHQTTSSLLTNIAISHRFERSFSIRPAPCNWSLVSISCNDSKASSDTCTFLKLRPRNRRHDPRDKNVRYHLPSVESAGGALWVGFWVISLSWRDTDTFQSLSSQAWRCTLSPKCPSVPRRLSGDLDFSIRMAAGANAVLMPLLHKRQRLIGRNGTTHCKVVNLDMVAG